ncbi:MAG: aminoglycoside phosphotransferase family protein [Thermoleophilia bacterium]
MFPPPGRPRAEVRFDPGLVRGLLRDQAPAYADLPFGAVIEGWDNCTVRLGARHAVRLPRRADAAPLIRHEQRWLPVLAPRLPLRVPVPVVAGAPACGFPWHWSVVEWVDGQSAASRPLSDPDALAGALADFLTALHTIAPADAPPNPLRGVPLGARDSAVRRRASRVARGADAASISRIWDVAMAAPPWTGDRPWIHGDLHPGNLIVDDGLVAVIDFGDLTAGDPATDLAVAWMLFTPGQRARFRAGLPAHDDATWRRAAGWSLNFALAVLDAAEDDPILAGIGRRTLEALRSDRSVLAPPGRAAPRAQA